MSDEKERHELGKVADKQIDRAEGEPDFEGQRFEEKFEEKQVERYDERNDGEPDFEGHRFEEKQVERYEA